MLLEVDQIKVNYGQFQAIGGVSLNIAKRGDRSPSGEQRRGENHHHQYHFRGCNPHIREH